MSGADSETTPAASLDVRPRQQTTKRGAGFTVTPLIRTREGANKQVISSQADSLIKISRIWGIGSNGTKNQRKKNISTFHRIALKSNGTKTYASKKHHF